MCSGAQIVIGLLGFKKQLPQNMTQVGGDGPKESLLCIVGHVKALKAVQLSVSHRNFYIFDITHTLFNTA